VEAVKRGVTSLVVCSTSFVTLGRRQLAALGAPDTPIAVIPHPFGLRTRDEVRKIAEQCVDEIARLALGGSDKTQRIPKAHSSADRAQQIEVPEDLEAFNAFCEERRWSDGLPLVAPTPERVERMLGATPRALQDVVATVAPGFGTASVEAIAINAVMAGCRPEYLPVLIAAVEAATERSFNLQGIQATTNPVAPWIIVNGPIARTLGINSAMNCLGQGTRANATIGRALRLVLQNIGGALPGEMDRATHGQPGKHTFCCAENEAQNPWEPLHVERGFDAAQSTVTVVGAAGTHNFNSHAKDANDLLKVFADSLRFPTSNDYHFGGQPWLVMSPEHADIMERGALAKSDVKRRLWDESKMAASRFAVKDYLRAQHTRRPELGEIGPETLLPISVEAEEIGIVVAGGPGTHSMYVPTFGQTRAVTRLIDASAHDAR
jgi:hypothetical protein